MGYKFFVPLFFQKCSDPAYKPTALPSFVLYCFSLPLLSSS